MAASLVSWSPARAKRRPNNMTSCVTCLKTPRNMFRWYVIHIVWRFETTQGIHMFSPLTPTWIRQAAIVFKWWMWKVKRANLSGFLGWGVSSPIFGMGAKVWHIGWPVFFCLSHKNMIPWSWFAEKNIFWAKYQGLDHVAELTCLAL